MARALDVAKFLLYLRDNDPRNLELSNLKLQKLLYYSQGYYLALTGDPLFDEPIEAWKYGPVVRDIYHEFRVYGELNIQRAVDSNDINHLTDKQKKVIAYVWVKLGELSAGTLVDMTHSETPWLNAWYYKKNNKEISNYSMLEYFKRNSPQELFNIE
jgi:uncharacterized phage-associated protein